MLMHARPSKSSTTRPPPIAVVRFRSMQHKQLEVWQRHCDCGAVDLPTASGISQESSVSVVRKNTKAYQRNSTREMGSKRKSSIESWRKISSPISIHQSIFSNFLSARVDIVSISLRSMSRRTFLHRKALSFSPRNDKQSARIAKCVASHSCVRKMPLLANFLALLGQVTDILRSAIEGRTRNSEFFNLKKKPGNKQFSIEITKRKDDGEKWPNIARAIVLKSELSQKRAVIGMRASNFCLPARHERRPTYFQSRTSNFRRSLLGECPMDTAKNREKRFHESVTNPCCSPSSPAEDTTATAVVNSTRIVNLTAITNNSCFPDIRTGAMSRFSRWTIAGNSWTETPTTNWQLSKGLASRTGLEILPSKEAA